MISPLVTLNSRSVVIFHRKRRPAAGPGRWPRTGNIMEFSLARPLNSAAGLGNRGRGLVARDDLVNAIEVFRVVLALGLRLADEGRGHQLMVALAVIDLVRLQLHVVGQLEIFERGG